MKKLKSTTVTINRIFKTDYISGEKILANLAELIRKNHKVRNLILISDKKVFALHGFKILSQLRILAQEPLVHLIPQGERGKDLATFFTSVQKLLSRPLTRDDCLIALGGGSVSDFAGFLASVLLRGIKLILIPTTLLSMVDAAVGGKNALNLKIKDKLIKNMIGTFYQPNLVITDLDLLKTLPDREIKNGFGEIIKYQIAFGRPAINNMSLSDIVKECQKIKLAIISTDPFDDSGVREKLNLGHTIGHAVESTAKGKISHGEAVAVGLVAAASMSCQLNLLKKETKEKIISLIKSTGLPLKIKGLKSSEILKALTFDKKNGRFVLIEGIGRTKIYQQIPAEIINNAILEVTS